MTSPTETSLLALIASQLPNNNANLISAADVRTVLNTIVADTFTLTANVKDYGATGDGITDDTAAIQAAIDDAFGPASAPHGVNYRLNKILFFPEGTYIINQLLNLTQVQGAIIEGSGKFATKIFNVNGTGCFQTNGLSFSTIRNMCLDGFNALGYGQLHDLSNTNLTVVRRYLPVSLNEQFSRSVASAATGKLFCELAINFQYGGVGNIIFGIGNAAQQSASGSFAGTGFVGGTTKGIGNAGGDVYFNNAIISNTEYFTESDVVGMAVDIDNKLIWWRSNAGNWNNNALADPATGVGGISFATIDAGPYYVYVDTNFLAGNSQVTANFGAAPYAHAAPAGYGNWGGGVPTQWDSTLNGLFSQFDLNWDGAGGVSLQSNTFQDIFFTGADIGVKIGGQGFMGSENLFLNCFFQGHYFAGVETRNGNALGNFIIGGNIQACYYGVHVSAGSVPTIQTQFQLSVQYDIFVGFSANDCYQVVSRSESTWFANFAKGQPVLQSCLHTTGFVSVIPGTSQIYSLTTADSLFLNGQALPGVLHEQIIGSVNGIGLASQKYCELKIDSSANVNDVEIGVGNSTVQRKASTSHYLGDDNNGIGMYGNGDVYLNNAILTTIQTFAVGDVIGIAVDTTAKLIWFRTNGGNWNNNALADPATGVGGINITAVVDRRPSGLFVYVDLPFPAYATTITANFGATAYAFAKPAGYGDFGGTWDSTYMRAPLLLKSGAPAPTIMGSISAYGYVDCTTGGTIMDSQIGRDDWTTPTSYWLVQRLRTGVTFDGSGVGTPNTLDMGRFYGNNFYHTPGGSYTQTTGSLPAASVDNAGERTTVSNSSVASAGNFGAIVGTSGGANIVPVYSDGTNWRIG